jgi:hypothetical protein
VRSRTELKEEGKKPKRIILDNNEFLDDEVSLSEEE